MPYYATTVREKKPGSKHRRKMAIEAPSREQAKFAFHQKCTAIDFAPDLTTLREITPREYEKIIGTLVGRRSN
jgi:hypothetical protein